MKRPILITVGIVLILLMVGVWLYLFLFGTPDGGGEVASNLGFDLSSRPAVVLEENLVTEPEYTVDTNTSRLSQLTTKPVAGYIATSTASTSYVRYVEQGTGHIYEVGLDGTEEMISRTTIPRVQEAYFSPNAAVVVLVSINGYDRDVLASTINEETKELELVTLPTNAMNIAVTSAGTVRYTFQTTDGSNGYESTLAGGATELFSVPFRSISVLWGETDTWVYNRPAVGLPGHVYKIVGGTYVSTPHSGYQLTADNLGDYIGITEVVNETLTSRFISHTDDQSFVSPVLVIPEKCDALNGTFGTVCAAPLNNTVQLDSWYKGLTQIEDYLWLVDAEGNQATLIENLTQTAGRQLDVSGLEVSATDEFILFTNKTDGTLWLYLI